MRNIVITPKKWKVYYANMKNEYLHSVPWRTTGGNVLEEQDVFEFEDDLVFLGFAGSNPTFLNVDFTKFTFLKSSFSLMLRSKYATLINDELVFTGKFTFCKKGKKIFLIAVDV